MPNNPYSPEAIKKRLSAKSTSSLFDSLTSNKDRESEKLTSCEDDTKPYMADARKNLMKDIVERRQLNPSSSTDEDINDRSSMSPSPRVLRTVLSEDLPQYKRLVTPYKILIK